MHDEHKRLHTSKRKLEKSYLNTKLHTWGQGRSQTFSFGGATGGASFATRGTVNGPCRTFRKRPTQVAWRHAENFGGHWGGQAKLWGDSGPPGAPSSAPA